MRDDLGREVRRRAGDRCEYCLIPQSADILPHQLDHIVARKHGGARVLENLALSCFPCNSHKGPNLSGIDPLTQGVTALFNPRVDQWSEHFALLSTGEIVGKTSIGRATIRVLNMNELDSKALRALLIIEGVLATSE